MKYAKITNLTKSQYHNWFLAFDLFGSLNTDRDFTLQQQSTSQIYKQEIRKTTLSTTLNLTYTWYKRVHHFFGQQQIFDKMCRKLQAMASAI